MVCARTDDKRELTRQALIDAIGWALVAEGIGLRMTGDCIEQRNELAQCIGDETCHAHRDMTQGWCRRQMLLWNTSTYRSRQFLPQFPMLLLSCH
jgi:hypothetical protein